MRASSSPSRRGPSLLEGESGILAVVWRLEPDEARGRAPRARAGERRQRRGRDHVGLARDDARGPRDARRDGRGALGGRLAGERGGAARAARRGRHLDAAALRRDLARARAAARRRRQRARAARRRATPDGGTRATLERETAEVLAPHGGHRGRYRRTGRTREGRELEWEGEIRLQWCCGAPGIVTVGRRPTSTRICCSQARRRSGAAGPHGAEKGAGICHGTAGNGYALLKTFERTRTSSGSSARAASPCTRSSRSRGAERGRAATRSGRATSASRSTPPTASTRERATRSWRPGPRPRSRRLAGATPGRSAARAPRRRGRRGS